MNEISKTNNRIETLHAVAKRLNKNVKSVQLWDPNVCDFAVRDSIVHVPISGLPFSDELTFKHKGRRVTILANSDWLCLSIRKSRSDSELPVVCSVNQPNKIDFRSETGLYIGNDRRHAIFLPRNDHPSSILLALLNSRITVRVVEDLIREREESLHIWKDGIDFYSKALSEGGVLQAVEHLTALLDEVLAIGLRRTAQAVDYDNLPAKFRELVPLIERWVESDDADRDALLDEASDAELQELVRVVEPRFQQINEYLDSFEGSPPESATGLGTLVECAAEARLKLSQRMDNDGLSQ